MSFDFKRKLNNVKEKKKFLIYTNVYDYIVNLRKRQYSVYDM